MQASFNRGFTLLELLISMGIVGVLVSIAVFGYSQVTKQSRDARRKADIVAVSHAIDQYYLVNDQQYPPTADCTGIASYLETKALPSDPAADVNPTYAYDFSNSCNAAQNGYCVCALMEEVGEGNAVNGSCNYGAGVKSYFCVNSKQ